MVKAIACFAKGTLISTENGEVEVQDLRAGDILRTHDGHVVPLRWVGHRHIDLKTCQENPLEYLPIRILKDAFASNVPSRDLYVSRCHAMLLDGRLFMAGRLFNKTTITVAPMGSIDYYHLECDRHTILVANGAPTESYLDTGTRSFFQNNDGAVSLRPTMPDSGSAAALAAPWTDLDSLVRIRQTLFDRAVELGFDNVYHPPIATWKWSSAA